MLRIFYCLAIISLADASTVAFAQSVPSSDERRIRTELEQLQSDVTGLKAKGANTRLVADVEIFAKGVEWCLRHEEFYAPKTGKGPSAYVKYCLDALAVGQNRAQEIAGGKPSWPNAIGSTIRGYVSRVDGSVQPYALSLPKSFPDAASGYRWPLHVVLHGRGGERNEVRFFAEHANKPPKEDQTWIQLDVFGRTDNGYRWAGETDVFEAIADVERRYRIDDRRITLWGFSMGGAGSWHLGLHYPSKWSSVGPGAGFVDFYRYQKQSEPLPEHQHKTLRIYDSIDYALNLANIPFCTYGGELDPQLDASTSVVERAKELDVPVKLLIGPGMGHKFHPDSFQEFMAFHREKSAAGRPAYPGAKSIRFVTYTLKYNRCEWLTIEELERHYEPALAEGQIAEGGNLKLTTKNIAALQVARDVADKIELDGQTFELREAADNLLPGVYFERGEKGEWMQLDYNESISFMKNPELRKRHNLQGPIDDAFMSPFLCVQSTGQPWHAEHQQWANWTLARFEREFDKWMRGRVPVIEDRQLTAEQIEDRNLVLFGDPGSNSVIAQVVQELPVRWTKDTFEVNGQKFDPKSHGVCLIYPNPLNPSRYVVINSGHTMHEKDFRASNAWLFPKLGDIGVVRFAAKAEGQYDESPVRADLFDMNWQFPR